MTTTKKGKEKRHRDQRSGQTKKATGAEIPQEQQERWTVERYKTRHRVNSVCHNFKGALVKQ